MIDGIMVSRMGEAAKFTKAERDMIEPSAAKILARMSPKTVKAITGFAEPMTLATGVFIYAMRLSSLSAKKAAAESASAPVQLRRETAPVATFRAPAGPVANAPVVQGRPFSDMATPVREVNGTVPRDGIGTVDEALAQQWGA